MEAKHTAGPWAGHGRKGPLDIPLRAHDCERLEFSPCFIITDSPRRREEALANARLIAAAPELLEALKAVTATEMFMPDHPQRQAAYKTARAAISKATQ